MDVSTPFELPNGILLKNRFIKAAMAEQLATKDRNPMPGIVTAYKTWAEGGAAVLISGNLMIDRDHMAEPRNAVLDEQSDPVIFRKWADAATTNGTQFWAQLNHPGKQIPSFIQEEPMGPSAIPLENGLEKAFNKPRAMTENDIVKVIGQFARSARLAKEFGFTGVQLHGAHGYLINQFLSTRHNHRDDKWGGSLENRMRFLLSVCKAVRAEVGVAFPVGIKLNSTDFAKGGFSEAESTQVIKALDDAGIDFVEISGGTYENLAIENPDDHVQKASTAKREAYFLQFAEQVRDVSKVPLIVTGGFRSTQGMNAALTSGATDLIGAARPYAIEPDFPKKAMADWNYKVSIRTITTGLTGLDRATFLNLSWYVLQIVRLSKGKRPNPNTSAWASIVRAFLNQGIYNFRKRRA